MKIDNLAKGLDTIFDEFAINIEKGTTDEVRFSGNRIDINNKWYYPSYSIFAARGKKTGEISFDRIDSWEKQLKILSNIIDNAPGSPDFNGINSTKFNYSHTGQNTELDLNDISSEMIQGSVDGGADSTAGLSYLHNIKNRIITPWNDQEYFATGLELVVRSFKDKNTGQEALHFGIDSMKAATPYETGKEAAKTASITDKKTSIDEGRYEVIFSPYTMGTVLSYNIGFLSYYSINAGLSPFIDKIGESIASENVTIYDDPLNTKGIGSRPVDQEGTATKKVNLIDHGILKTYLHSFSTGKLSGNSSTGNAGIMDPVPWQIHMSGGNNDIDDMIHGVKKGLFINNSWYTRFQDQNTGTFSTVPRDGVFLIENGEIAGTVSGIRISDSILNILQNISEVSKQEKYVKWWDEIHPSIMPYALIENVNITKGF